MKTIANALFVISVSLAAILFVVCAVIRSPAHAADAPPLPSSIIAPITITASSLSTSNLLYLPQTYQGFSIATTPIPIESTPVVFQAKSPTWQVQGVPTDRWGGFTGPWTLTVGDNVIKIGLDLSMDLSGVKGVADKDAEIARLKADNLRLIKTIGEANDYIQHLPNIIGSKQYFHP